MHHPIDPEGPDCGPSKGRQQNPSHGIAQGVPETPFQGLDNELAGPSVLGRVGDLHTLGKNQSGKI
jgi:hypothetical protein